MGETGAFFGHVDRFEDGIGFFGAAEPGEGRPLGNGWSLDPPDLIIQDELHLIAGPLGTVAGLYEAAIDQLASRGVGEKRVRPKIVASTATVRRAADQIAALFDRSNTSIFPPPGIDRVDSFFARTVSSSVDPARLYLGIGAQGRGPKLVFLRSLTTLVAAAQAAYDANVPADGVGRKGHLQDIDWRWVVHGSGPPCLEPMWVEEKGTSADPADTSIVCGCGRRLSLQETFQPGRLGKCLGNRPWLLDRDPEGCGDPNKLP